MRGWDSGIGSGMPRFEVSISLGSVTEWNSICPFAEHLG